MSKGGFFDEIDIMTLIEKDILIGSWPLKLIMKSGGKSRRICLSVRGAHQAILSRPRWVSLHLAERFFWEKKDWVLSKMKYLEGKEALPHLPAGRGNYLKYKEAARKLILARVGYYGERLGLKYGKICVRDQKTRWGSCSKKGNLNFNYHLIFLEKREADYIIVHELCHLREFNHSEKFWGLVGKVMPDYLEIRGKIRGRKLDLI